MCFLLMRAPATDAHHFAHPLAFEPDRWLREETAHAKRVSMPFGAGPRMCPGRYLALLEIKMAIATLLGGFDLASVAAADGGEVREKLSFTMGPTPLLMRLHAR